MLGQENRRHNERDKKPCLHVTKIEAREKVISVKSKMNYIFVYSMFPFLNAVSSAWNKAWINIKLIIQNNMEVRIRNVIDVVIREEMK